MNGFRFVYVYSNVKRIRVLGKFRVWGHWVSWYVVFKRCVCVCLSFSANLWFALSIFSSCAVLCFLKRVRLCPYVIAEQKCVDFFQEGCRCNTLGFEIRDCFLQSLHDWQCYEVSALSTAGNTKRCFVGELFEFKLMNISRYWITSTLATDDRFYGFCVL